MGAQGPPAISTVPLFVLSRSINEMKRLEEVSSIFQSSGVEHHTPEPKSQIEGPEGSEDGAQQWEMVMDKRHFKLWRRPIMGTHLYQYRGEWPPPWCLLRRLGGFLETTMLMLLLRPLADDLLLSCSSLQLSLSLPGLASGFCTWPWSSAPLMSHSAARWWEG